MPRSDVPDSPWRLLLLAGVTLLSGAVWPGVHEAPAAAASGKPALRSVGDGDTSPAEAAMEAEPAAQTNDDAVQKRRAAFKVIDGGS